MKIEETCFDKKVRLHFPQKRVCPKTLRRAGKAAAVLLVVLLIVWLRVLYGSMEDYKTGETLLRENQTIRAITYFDRSLHWYAPLNPYVGRSAERLWEIGESAEEAKDTRLALIAFESIRNGFYGASNFFRPGQDWVQSAERKIQSFSTLQGNKEAVTAMKDPQPAVLWSTVVVFGFLGWIGSLAGFILWVFRKEKRSGRNARRAVVWIGLATIFFGLWILGMALA